jgi:hypothetical protein
VHLLVIFCCFQQDKANMIKHIRHITVPNAGDNNNATKHNIMNNIRNENVLEIFSSMIEEKITESA